MMKDYDTHAENMAIIRKGVLSHNTKFQRADDPARF